MNHRHAHLLMRLYPRPWRERYGAEFEALLEAGSGGVRASANVVWSALGERIFPTPGLGLEQSRSQSWSARAPWAIFGLAPVFLLGGAYLVACLILWSGWKIFLPGTDTPFVPIDGFAVFYFGVGRLLYYAAPILVGWGIGLAAARERQHEVWPTVGLLLNAFIGGTAQVHASRPLVPGGIGRISMGLAVGSMSGDLSSGLVHVLVIFAITALPYLIWRFRRDRSLSA